MHTNDGNAGSLFICFQEKEVFFMKCVHECISKREGEQQGLGKQEEQIQ